MDEQPLNLKRSARAVRQHWALVALVTLVGLALGLFYGLLRPLEVSSSSLVLVSSPARETGTQLVIAQSDPVLARTLGSLRSEMSVDELRQRVRVKSLSYNLINIQATGETSAEAKRIADALAESYVAYIGSRDLPTAPVQARVLAPAGEGVAGTSKRVRLATSALLGLLGGLVIGMGGAIAVTRSDKRLRERDQIADIVGSPVLAGITARVPSNAEDWRSLLEDYRPLPVDAFQLRRALKVLWDIGGGPTELCVAVFALHGDRKALAVGPQLAAYAASHGMATTLTGAPSSTLPEALQAALEDGWASGRRAEGVRVASGDDSMVRRGEGARLSISLTLVDGRAPLSFEVDAHTGVNILAVSAGFADGQQLLGVVAGAAAAGHRLHGVFLVDPDPADGTTGGVVPVRHRARSRAPRRSVRSAAEMGQ